ncbi:MAG: TetR/AcrR family transcriptional regulator [Deltaproteobacteria bacterium]|nr:TetR/AcrR family transcriptional regulator [Deltaproteobacteria bacterium]
MAIRVPKKPAHAYQHGNLRHALIQAGLRLLSEGGVANLSLRAAAQLAGVSHAAPYRHFADKEALVAAIAEEGFALLTAALQASTPPTPAAFAKRLAEMAVAYVNFALAHPAYLRVIFGGVVDKEHAPQSLRIAGETAYGVLRTLVADGVAAGAFRAGDVDEMALSCWSMVHGFGMLLSDRALPPPLCEAVTAEAMTRSLVKHLLGGIESGAPPTKS